MSILEQQSGLIEDVTNALYSKLRAAARGGGKLSFELYQPYLKEPTQRGHIVMTTRLGSSPSVVRMAENITKKFAAGAGLGEMNGSASYIIAHEAENRAAIRLGLFTPQTEKSDLARCKPEPALVQS